MIRRRSRCAAPSAGRAALIGSLVGFAVDVIVALVTAGALRRRLSPSPTARL